MLCRQFQWLRSPKSELLKSLKAPHAHSATLKPLMYTTKLQKKGRLQRTIQPGPGLTLQRSSEVLRTLWLLWRAWKPKDVPPGWPH